VKHFFWRQNNKRSFLTKTHFLVFLCLLRLCHFSVASNIEKVLDKRKSSFLSSVLSVCRFHIDETSSVILRVAVCVLLMGIFNIEVVVGFVNNNSDNNNMITIAIISIIICENNLTTVKTIDVRKSNMLFVLTCTSPAFIGYRRRSTQSLWPRLP